MRMNTQNWLVASESDTDEDFVFLSPTIDSKLYCWVDLRTGVVDCASDEAMLGQTVELTEAQRKAHAAVLETMEEAKQGWTA
jgi:hypothetical protein